MNITIEIENYEKYPSIAQFYDDLKRYPDFRKTFLVT